MLLDDAKMDLLAGAHLCRHRPGIWNSVSADEFGEQTYIKKDFRCSHELPKDGALPSHGFEFRDTYSISYGKKTLVDKPFPGSQNGNSTITVKLVKRHYHSII